jgi:hypothetical protein
LTIFTLLYSPFTLPLPVVASPSLNIPVLYSWAHELWIYLKECKSGYNKDICTPMLIASLFIIKL